MAEQKDKKTPEALKKSIRKLKIRAGKDKGEGADNRRDHDHLVPISIRIGGVGVSTLE